MNAVIYARYSSAMQTEQSIEGQLRSCNSFAEKHNISIIDTYVDRAISGTASDNRPAFQQMIQDSQKRLFDIVIVYKLDRFARNRYDSAIYRNKLKNNNVIIMSAMENTDGSPESVLMESVLEGMAEYYSLELSQKVKRGKKESALKCQVLGGTPPLGYYKDKDKKFAIDEKTAPVVQQIFTMYNDGSTMKEIETYLNSKNIKTSRGTEFNKSSLKRILTNEKYIGVYKAIDVVVEDGIPPIIEKGLFNSVAQIMNVNRKAPARAKSPVNFMLTTKLICGECGANYVGESGTGHQGNKYYYYKCSTKKKQGKCKNKPLKKDFLEDLVIKTTCDVILKDDVIDYIANKAYDVQLEELSNDTVRKCLDNTLTDVEKSLKNILKAIEQGIFTETTKTRLLELEEQKKSLEIEILKNEISRKPITVEQIRFFLNGFKNGSVDDEKYRKELINTFVNSVRVYDDKLVLYYNYSNDNNEIISSDLEPSFAYSKINLNKSRFIFFV